MTDLSRLLSGESIRSGCVAVMGRPNVGKSTLLNALMGQKVVITSEKPQTTRNRILCVYSDEESQILFFDTPGMHKPKDELNRHMVEQAREALSEADLVLLMAEFTEDLEVGPGDRYLVQLLKETGLPFYTVLNKVDLGCREDVEVLGQKWSALLEGAKLYPTSATLGAGAAELLSDIKANLPEGPRYFDDLVLTDRSERFIVGELIREKIFRLTRQEVPHSTAVLVEEMKDRGGEDKLFIKAVIYVETNSQKGIIIGKKGAMLKEIGKQAREDIEKLLNIEVYLDLWVKVQPHWRRDKKFIEKLEHPHLQ
jgi:GTPase